VRPGVRPAWLISRKDPWLDPRGAYNGTLETDFSLRK
jgi:hypothetical protein